MAINQGSPYDKIVVHFDPNTFGILHIKAFDGVLEQGSIDRETSDATGIRPGLYHPEDPDIIAVVDQVHARRINQDLLTTDGIALIYRFGPNNDVDVTRMNIATHPRYAFFMLMDPIHTAVRNKEDINTFAGGAVTGPHQHTGCVTGRIKLTEKE